MWDHERLLPGEPTEEASTGESQVSVKRRKQGKEVWNMKELLSHIPKPCCFCFSWFLCRLISLRSSAQKNVGLTKAEHSWVSLAFRKTLLLGSYGSCHKWQDKLKYPRGPSGNGETEWAGQAAGSVSPWWCPQVTPALISASRCLDSWSPMKGVKPES